MPRLLLNDEHWSKLREILLHKAIYNKRDLRMTVEGMLYRMRTGCPWRDLPKAFGNWNKGYDSERIREQVERQGAKAVIPRKRNSVKGNANLDRGLYRNRHLVENAFARLKHYRAVASRFDKLKRNYESVVAMAYAFLWLPM
ncbi:transposase [Pseudomonas sp. GD03721]|nr:MULTISPECIES: transposase [Pseudomonas]MDH1442733.1 transposase [Pseudomonas sp. GD03722]MDV5862580.1 transposase [Pseudomonas mendocina]WGG00782.1 transposase [Pseudomonas sp. GD03721]WGG04950.1 transposase [Pseudomonas sp. GD03919]